MMPYYQMNTFHIVMRSNSTYSGLTLSGGFRGGALGALAPPAESMEKNLNLPFFSSMYDMYLFACSVRPV